MKVAWVLVGLLSCPTVFAATDCVKGANGAFVCSNGQKAVAVNPNTGHAATAQKGAAGVTTVQGSNGSKAAYNPRTGNAAVSTTNQNGVTTTNTRRGGEAKTKNGMGVAEGPNGTVCAKGKNNQGCTKK